MVIYDVCRRRDDFLCACMYVRNVVLTHSTKSGFCLARPAAAGHGKLESILEAATH